MSDFRPTISPLFDNGYVYLQGQGSNECTIGTIYKNNRMKRRQLILCTVLLVFVAVGGQSQTAEYNTGNIWTLPDATKTVGIKFANDKSGVMMNNGTMWYKNNFLNDGIVSYDATLALSPGLSRFEGTALQSFSGAGTTNFYHIIFNNLLKSGAFSLGQDIHVYGNADFLRGILTAVQTTLTDRVNRVDFASGTTVTNVSDSSHVDGFVSKTGNSTFTFPIGNKGHYRWAAISAPSQATDCYAARYINEDPALYGYPRTKKARGIGAVSTKEFWVLERTAGTSNINLILSWNTATTSARIMPNVDKMGIVRWDGNQWIQEKYLISVGNAASGSIKSSVTGYGIFTLAAIFQPPVAVNDTITVLQNSSLQSTVATNDTLSEAGDNIWTVQTAPLHGTLTLTTDGSYTYVPNVNYSGKDSVTYLLSDIYENQSLAKIIITVTPISDYLYFNKTASSPALNIDGTYTVDYTFSLTNKTGTTIESIKVTDDLSKVFTAPVTYRVTNITASGNLKANSLYDGTNNTATLLDGSSLTNGKADSIVITVKVDPHLSSGEFLNQATLNAYSIKTGVISDIYSDDTTNITASYPRPTIIRLAAVTISVPDGFSPNGDGFNDKFVIIHESDLTVNLKVFNRAGTLVYHSADYQNDWDGKGTSGFLGDELLNGTYFYVFETRNRITGETKQYNGFITLQR
jgi:gliding motility-associated-like protein